MKTSYTFPNAFDPYYAVYALKGLADLVFEFHTEGPGVNRTLQPGEHVALVGLAWLNLRVANELNEYFAALSEAGHEFPDAGKTYAVREEPAVYAVK